MVKFVMKNEETGEYWCDQSYPPICKTPWEATKFDSASESQRALNALLSSKYDHSKFKPVKIRIVEEIEE